MNSAELREALNERVKDITFGYVPNDDDTHALMWNSSILVIQRLPADLKKHRVCVIKEDKISVYGLRRLVCAEWRDDYT